jgi:hypothetical protein
MSANKTTPVLFIGGCADGDVVNVKTCYPDHHVLDTKTQEHTHYIIEPLIGDNCVWRIARPADWSRDTMLREVLERYADRPVPASCEVGS